MLEATITGPLKELVRDRSTDRYLAGELAYVQADGSEVRLPLRIRARGNFRRENCDYPPAWLRFNKSDVKGTLFEGQRRLKLVVHCERPTSYEQAVLREYLAYRLFNLLTDRSFNVRLLRIRYSDKDDVEPRPARYAFLIEHKDRLAERIGRKEFETKHASVAAIDPAQLNLTSLFQFFLGNTDFSPIYGAPGENCCHNYELFSSDDELLWAIPYDFDQSGFVNAPYAEPDPRLRIQDVRRRLYRGRCANNAHVNASVQQFRDRRNAIDALIAEQVGINQRTRRSIERYVDAFFDLIDAPDEISEQIIAKCLD